MSNNSSNSNSGAILAGIKEAGHKVFGGYAELLRIPHTARYSIGSVIACMPFPMVGMTITISVQHYYGNFSLAGISHRHSRRLRWPWLFFPLLGKLTDKFGQKAGFDSNDSGVDCRRRRASHIHHQSCAGMGAVLFDAVLAAIPPWGAMSRARWTKV